MSFPAGFFIFILIFAAGGDKDGLASRYGFADLEIYKAEWGIFDLAFADLDGDGRDDFGFVNNARSRLELFLRLPESAPDRFDPSDPGEINAVTYDGRFRKTPIAVEKEVLGLAFGRFDDDATMDAAFVTSTAEVVTVFRGRERREVRKTLRLEDFNPRRKGIIAADLDGDGRDELLLLGEKKTLLLGRSGVLKVIRNFRPRPASFALGDFDGDGLKDLLLVYCRGSYPFVVRFQEAPGIFGPAVTWKADPVRAAAVADTEGDGRDEILAVYAGSGRLARFGLEERRDPLFRYYVFRPSGDAENFSVTAADIDGDGAGEILVADAGAASLAVFGGFRGGKPAAVERRPSLKGVRDPRVADLDGDGIPELAVISGPEGVIGVSSLAGGDVPFPRFVPVPGEPLAMDAGDVTGDGRADAVCLSCKGEGSRREYILSVLHHGEKGEELASRVIQESRPKKRVIKKPPRDLLLADVDRDGRQDVILFVPGEVPVIFLNGGGGRPFETVMGGETPGLGILEDAREWSVCSADADGDGLPELAAATGNLVRYLFVPPGGSIPQAAGQYNSPRTGDVFSGCAVADVAGGKRPDLVLFEERTKTVRIVDREGAPPLEIDAAGTSFRGFSTFDLDGDGGKDVILEGRDGFGVLLAGERCGSMVEEEDPYENLEGDARYIDIAVGDVNGDGAVEAVLADSGRKAVEIVALTKSGMKHALAFRVFEEKLFEGKRGSSEPHRVRVHDLTGDGKEDVIVLVHDKIVVYPQEQRIGTAGPGARRPGKEPSRK